MLRFFLLMVNDFFTNRRLWAIVLPACRDIPNSVYMVTELDKRLLDNRRIVIAGAVDDAVANVTIVKLLFLHQRDPQAPIFMEISSHGGAITAALAILDTMAFVSAPVHTYGSSHVNGVALWLLAAGEPGCRRCASHCHLSIETIMTEKRDPETLAFVEKMNASLMGRLASQTKITKLEIQEALQTGRSFGTAEALALEIVDLIQDTQP